MVVDRGVRGGDNFGRLLREDYVASLARLFGGEVDGAAGFFAKVPDLALVSFEPWFGGH